MSYQEVKMDHSFQGLTKQLLDVAIKGSETYFLFTREEAKKLNFMFKYIWAGYGNISVSYFYKGEETIAFKAEKPNYCLSRTRYPLNILNESIKDLFEEEGELTDADRDFFLEYFGMKKQAA